MNGFENWELKENTPQPLLPQGPNYPRNAPHPAYSQPSGPGGQNPESSPPVPPGYFPPQNPGYPPQNPGYPPGPHSAVVTQPAPTGGPPMNWMPTPQAPPPGCPPGLEYLTMVDQLLVHQVLEIFELMTGYETENKYHVRNSLGQDVYYAIESSDWCARNCIGGMREFNMKIQDNFQNEVIHIFRPLACGSCCCPCCLQSLEVFAPPGNPIGSVHQECSLFPSFNIKNANRDIVLRIEGPFWTSGCCKDVTFRVTTADGMTDVGKITKQWMGYAREMYSDVDNFSISFPMELDVKIKAVLLGALFLIDFMYFEHGGHKR